MLKNLFQIVTVVSFYQRSMIKFPKLINSPDVANFGPFDESKKNIIKILKMEINFLNIFDINKINNDSIIIDIKNS